MPAVFQGLTDYTANGAGLFVPSWMKQGDQPLMRAISQLAQGVDTNAISPSEKRTLDKQLEKKIGTLFRIYYNLWNSSVAWGAAEKPVSTPTTELLRETMRQSLIDRLLVNARVFQVRHVCRRVAHDSHEKGWSVKHKRWEEYDYKPTPDIDRRCQEMEELILHPNPEIHGGVNPLRDALAKMVRGELVLDRKVMIVIKNKFGIPQSWHLLPPDHIKPRLQVLLKHMQVFKFYSQDQAIQDIWNKFQVDLTNAAYVQEIDNKIFGAWTADECIVDYVNPSDEMDRWGWGVSPLEESLEATTLLMLGLYYNKQNFLSNYPEAFLFINGDVDQEGLEVFKKQIYAQIGTQGNQRLPVFATGDSNFRTELHRLRDSLTDMQFIQLLRFAIALKCAAYRAHPSLINFSPDMGDSKALINEEDQESVIANSQEEGYHSLLANLGDFITAGLIEPVYDDLRVVWSIEDRPTKSELIDLWTKRVALGDTIDEYRRDMHEPPLEEVTDGQFSGKMVNSPFALQYAQMKEQSAMQQQQLQMEQQRNSGEGFSGMEAQEGQAPSRLQGR